MPKSGKSKNRIAERKNLIKQFSSRFKAYCKEENWEKAKEYYGKLCGLEAPPRIEGLPANFIL